MTDYLHALPSGYRIEEYELVRVLGSGGFGITYLGYDHHLDKPMAIKEYLPNDLAVRGDNQSVLPRSTEDTPDYEWGLERFLNEAQTLARFDHRHIIKVHRFFRVHGTGYIVMEYAEGETLSELLQRKGTLTDAELKHILLPILDGLEAVHEADFLHRDIKPKNIVIRDDGSPVLIDFGSARQAVVGKSRSVTAIVTPGYAPIEQYSAKGHQGPWTDIYALGAVCYRCLAGEPPDDVTERLREDPLVPAGKRCAGKAGASLLGAIDRALRVNEKERPQSIKEWRSELEGADDTSTERPAKDKSLGESTSTATEVNEDRNEELASRRSRLGAWLVDVFLVSIPAGVVLNIWVTITNSHMISPQEFVVPLLPPSLVVGVAAYALMNGYFLVQRGQTLGKMLFRIRIVDAKSKELVSFQRVFVLRWLVCVFFAHVPALNYMNSSSFLEWATITSFLALSFFLLVCLIDSCFIFGKQRRCLHDYFAGTIVVNDKERLQGIAAWRKILAGIPESRKDNPASADRLVTARVSATTGKRMGRTEIVLVAIIVLLLGASVWRGWQLYRGVPGNDTGESIAVEEQPADTRAGSQADVASDAQAGSGVEAALDTGRPVAEPVTLPPAEEEDELTRLLAAAEADLAARRLTTPAGNNAWEKYQRVLELSPANPEAIAGMERVVASYKDLFDRAMAQEKLDKAAGYLARIRELNPSSPLLAEGERQLAATQQALEVRARELAGEMVDIPGGTFRMGDLSGEGKYTEKPVHTVTVPAFRLGKYEVTVGQFRRFVLVTGYRTDAEQGTGNAQGCHTLEKSPNARSYTPGRSWQEIDKDGNVFNKATMRGLTPGRSWRDLEYPIEENQPVVCVSWDDTQAFIQWLSEQTGKTYRLPTEAEWEYAVRAGSETLYHFGDEAERLCEFGNVADTTELPDGSEFTYRAECDDGAVFPASVGSYRPNAFGLHDMHGNVWEWVEDCMNSNYNYIDAPGDGSAWTSGDCGQRVVRGGSWRGGPGAQRSALRNWLPLSPSPPVDRWDFLDRWDLLGFRLAQDK